MCGIAGFFALSPRPLAPRAVLERMVEAVRHRGPDDGGVYLDDRVGLGHRRLSIVDLSGGRQPLSDLLAQMDLRANQSLLGSGGQEMQRLVQRSLGQAFQRSIIGCSQRAQTRFRRVWHQGQKMKSGSARCLQTGQALCT